MPALPFESETMENPSFLTNQVAIRTLLVSWLLSGGLCLVSLHSTIATWLYFAFFVGHGILVALIRELISRHYVVHSLSRDYLIAIIAPYFGPLVWYYRCKNNMVSLDRLSSVSRFGMIAILLLIFLLSITPLLLWILK